MASLAAHAIEIETDDGTGNPLSYTNTAIGASSGKFYLITDRFGIDGSKTIAGDTTRTVWYEGLLTKDYSSFSPSRSADFIESGDLASASSFSFSIKNTAAFWNTLEANSVYLARCRVTYYYVTSTDGVTFTFTKRWTGIIEDQPFGELAYKIQCIDNAKDIFGSIPGAAVDATAFPLAPVDSLGKQIPIAIGRVPFSPLQSVILQGQKVNLIKINGDEYPVCAATGYVAGTLTLTLYNKGQSFDIDDSRLVGNSVVVIKGGVSQARRILSNAATSATAETTAVVLEQALDTSTAFVAWSGSSQLVWYFNVVGFSNSLIASGKPIYSFLNNAIGYPALYTWDSSSKTYTDISEVKRLQSTSNIETTGFPGQKLLAKTVDISGNLDVYYPIVPDRIVLVSLSSGSITPSSGAAVAAGSELPFLTDQASADYYELSVSGTATLVLDVYFPSNFIEKTFSGLYLLFNASHRVQSLGTGVMQLQIDLSGKDVYERETSDVVSNKVWFNGSPSSLGTNFVDRNRLPAVYFNLEGNDSDFYASKDEYDFSSLIGDMKTSVAYRVVRFEISYTHAAADCTYQNRLKEMGFVAKTAVSFNSEPVYSTLIGETFGTRWRDPAAPTVNRKTSADPQYLIGDALEGLIRRYDYPHPVRQSSFAYKAGERSRTPEDNGYIYVCTVAGTTGANAAITGAANNGSGLIRITAAAHGLATGNAITIAGVLGTTEANGNWTVTVISSSTYDLQGSTFTNAYTSGGTVTPNPTTTLAGTTTDGTVTWKALDTLKIHCASFDTLATQRANWFIGRTLTEKKKSEEYYKELARHGFFGIMTDAHGRVKVKSWIDNRTPTVTFSSTNIVKGSIGEMRLSSMRRVYNDLLIRYDWNPASGNFNKQIFVTHVDEPEFPTITELVTPPRNLGTFSVTLTPVPFSSFYLFVFTCSSAHGMVSGDLASLAGNTHGYDFEPRQVSVSSTTVFAVLGSLVATNPSTTGTLSHVTDSRLKWKSFVGGVEPHGVAKGLWDQCHASYLVSKTVQKLPQELSDCYWFIDPAAKDPSGNSIWSELADAGNEHPAYYYAMMLADWVTWQKKQIPLEAANDATNRALELFDPVYFNDAKLTNSVAKLGWIHEITDLPGQGPDDPDRIRFGITFNPDQLASCTFLYDTEGDSDTITDTAGAADTIQDQAC